jgi:hypothetical protein
MVLFGGTNTGGESLATAYYELRDKLTLWETKLRDARHGCEDAKTKERITWLLDDLAIYRNHEAKGARRIYELIKIFRAYAGKVDV